MAQNNMTSDASETVYGIVGNIPKSYRSSHLRNYFSQFVESGAFECFHFKHRPESRKESPETADGSSRVAATNSVSSQREPTTCCIVKLKRANLRRLVILYSRKHWMDDEGNSVPSLCIVAEIDLKDGSPGYPDDQGVFTAADLKSLPELRPPPLMPQGNVGTPTKHFLELIGACRLPSQVIKNLGLRFPSQRRNKKYGCVPYDYTNAGTSNTTKTRGNASGTAIESNDSHPDSDATVEQGVDDYDVFTAAGHILHKEGDICTAVSRLPTGDATDDIERKYMDPGSDSGEEDDDTCEDWERHEAIHDDAGNYERNEERLFEEKIELKWEKGGSGLVFYTDAQVWQKAEGDFDEQTADDWDVDMSVYYDENGGDKDARDSVAMRKEKRLRLGLDDDDGVPRTGAFERYTKGVGRRLLMQSGWKEGGRLGKSTPGLAEALECDGQHPRDRKGFGYMGEKVNRYYGNLKRLRQAKEGLPIITTVYDNPKETDPGDTLLRRQNPHNLKYRTSYGAAAFVPASRDTGD